MGGRLDLTLAVEELGFDLDFDLAPVVLGFGVALAGLVFVADVDAGEGLVSGE